MTDTMFTRSRKNWLRWGLFRVASYRPSPCRSRSALSQASSPALHPALAPQRHPSPPRMNEPICTLSQLLAYFDGRGKKVAEAHRFVRPDGTIGASGMPDPKYVLHEGA